MRIFKEKWDFSGDDNSYYGAKVVFFREIECNWEEVFCCSFKERDDINGKRRGREGDD